MIKEEMPMFSANIKGKKKLSKYNRNAHSFLFPEGQMHQNQSYLHFYVRFLFKQY